MSESQIAEALHAALDAETSGLSARPDAARRARRQGRRRKVTRSLMAGIPAVALAVGGAIIAAHVAGTSSPAASHPAVVTAAYLTKQVESTLISSNVDNYIIESTPTDTGSESVASWADPATGHIQSVDKSASGTVTNWATVYQAGGQWYTKSIVVDTAAKSVTTSMFRGQTGVAGVGGFFGDPDYGQALATGQATIAGKSVIDGQPVIDLHLNNLNEIHAIDAATGSTSASDADFWVNSQDFQLVKLVWGEGPHSLTSYFHWFPRTKALVTQVDTPQIPAGYRQVSAAK